MEIEVLNRRGEIKEKIAVSEKVLKEKISIPLLHGVVKGYLNNMRLGTASTKNRGMVSGSGRKPWRQKGTGRARVGSIRTPLWKGGGVVFGPMPRSFSEKISPKIKRKALRMSIKDKIENNKIKIIDELTLENYKTKEAVRILKNLNLNKVLIVLGEGEEKARRAFQNIKDVEIIRARDLNAYQVLKFPEILFTKNALNIIWERIDGV